MIVMIMIDDMRRTESGRKFVGGNLLSSSMLLRRKILSRGNHFPMMFQLTKVKEKSLPVATGIVSLYLSFSLDDGFDDSFSCFTTISVLKFSMEEMHRFFPLFKKRIRSVSFLLILSCILIDRDI